MGPLAKNVHSHSAPGCVANPPARVPRIPEGGIGRAPCPCPPHPPSSKFRNVLDFGAVGDGRTDDTAAIQRAINHDRGERNAKTAAVVYFPTGNYLVSDTLVTWCNTELRGNSLFRPTITLAPNSPGFGSASALRPVIATNAGYNQNLSNPTAMPQWYDNSLPTNDMFYMHIHNLNLDLTSPGNAGAVGIYWCVAQQTSLRNRTQIVCSQKFCKTLSYGAHESWNATYKT